MEPQIAAAHQAARDLMALCAAARAAGKHSLVAPIVDIEALIAVVPLVRPIPVAEPPNGSRTGPGRKRRSGPQDASTGSL